MTVTHPCHIVSSEPASAIEYEEEKKDGKTVCANAIKSNRSFDRQSGILFLYNDQRISEYEIELDRSI